MEYYKTMKTTDTLLDYKANRNSGNENGNGTENGNDNRNGSHDSGSGRTLHISCECTYKEFLNCQPLNFKRTEGAVGLAYWFEKMESVFHISNCVVECQVKYATCILLGGALTCLLSKKQDLEVENGLWNLTVKGTDLVGGNVTSSKPTRLQEAIQIANSLMDQKVRVYAARQADNKRIMKSNPRDDHVQQPPYERQKVLRAYIAGPDEKKENYRSECPELKNQNRGNQAGSSEARGRVYALGGGEADQDPSNIADNADA
ncbi:hypothetical protein Tco_0262136 [Tanacetum coccineum]